MIEIGLMWEIPPLVFLFLFAVGLGFASINALCAMADRFAVWLNQKE